MSFTHTELKPGTDKDVLCSPKDLIVVAELKCALLAYVTLHFNHV